MIDLKTLEKEIDDLLEQETTDSLLEWFYSKNVRNLLGVGNYKSIKANIHGKFVFQENLFNIDSPESTLEGEEISPYSLAA